jgi:hypothetical protein
MESSTKEKSGFCMPFIFSGISHLDNFLRYGHGHGFNFKMAFTEQVLPPHISLSKPLSFKMRYWQNYAVTWFPLNGL